MNRSTPGVNLTWDSTTNPSCSTYPCQDQIGAGIDTGWGTAQTVEGLYAWNNTTPTGNITMRLNPSMCAATSTIIQSNRDYFNVASVTAAKAAGLAADYAAYTCPHPLAGSGTCGTTVGRGGYALGAVAPTVTIGSGAAVTLGTGAVGTLY